MSRSMLQLRALEISLPHTLTGVPLRRDCKCIVRCLHVPHLCNPFQETSFASNFNTLLPQNYMCSAPLDKQNPR